MTQHFLDLHQLNTKTLRQILNSAAARKAARKGYSKGQQDADAPLAGKALAMIFEKPSTRTRVSFDMGMRQLGGQSILLSANEMQLGRGESIADTARVLSRYVDAIMIRCHAHDKLLKLAEYAQIPVINGLTDDSHPCQIMADLLTVEERLGDLKHQKIAWVGDGNNVTTSFIHAAAQFGFELSIATPKSLAPSAKALAWAQMQQARISVTQDPNVAVENATVIVTDTWLSMNDSDDVREKRHNLLRSYQVNDSLMAKAAENAVFLHCLPAHRNEEVTDAVMDGSQSAVFDEAENRLHAQKAVLTWCLQGI